MVYEHGPFRHTNTVRQVKTLSETVSSYVWGADISVSSVNLGWSSLDGRERGIVLIEWDGDLRGGERLAAARSAVYDAATFLAMTRPAIWAGVEQPSGMARNMALVYMAGVIQEAVAAALRDHWQTPVAVYPVNSFDWKKLAGFPHNLGKPTKKKLDRKPELDDYPVFKWAQELCPEVATWDDADSVGITDYVREKVLQSA